jgi:FtsZ-interacting cell division protein ZipA
MDASALRWVLAIIGIVLLVGIYLFGLHQNRLRKRAAIETFTREDIDSTFIEDEQLREELDNLNQIMQQGDLDDGLDHIKINPAIEANLTPIILPLPELFTADLLGDIEEQHLISYLLKHADHRLITGEEIENVLMHSEFEIGAEGYLEYHQDGEHCFTITSLSPPGHFSDMDQLNFSTLGFNCFIDIESNPDAAKSFEQMLIKVDELVRLLDVRVYQPNHELLTMANIKQVRKRLKG